MRSALGFLLPPLLLGCVQVSWERESRFDPIELDALQQLEPGKSELGDCLRLFGAPLWVWEQPAGKGTGAVLAYGWFHGRDLGLRFSVPVSDYYSASLDYEGIDQRMRGLVLFFGQDWKLSSWRTGLLRDLTREAGRPPAYVEEES